jgi:hypothetical protein
MTNVFNKVYNIMQPGREIIWTKTDPKRIMIIIIIIIIIDILL